MHLKIDHEADALYLSLSDAPASDSEEVAPGVVVDYDAQENIVGIELLYLSKRAPEAHLQRLLFESYPPNSLQAAVREIPDPYDTPPDVSNHLPASCIRAVPSSYDA